MVKFRQISQKLKKTTKTDEIGEKSIKINKIDKNQ